MKVAGRDCVDWIVENNIQRGVPMVVHSLNPNGSRYMHDKLKEAWYEVHKIPFNLLGSKLTVG